MKLRALQDAIIHTPQGIRLIQGPEVSIDGARIKDGQEVEVADDFVVNREVWEVLAPKPKQVRYAVVKKPEDASSAAPQFEIVNS